MEIRLNVTGLFIYPLKSCKGIALQTANLNAEGLQYDRQWMVLVGESGRFRTQRDIPLMSQIETALQGNQLLLSRPGYGSIGLPLTDSHTASSGEHLQTKIWDDACDTVVASEEASSWLTQALESTAPLKIVRMAPGYVRPLSHNDVLGEGTHIQFADAAPFLVTEEASLGRLNEVLVEKGEQAVPMNRFRPNIVVRGAQPFEEHGLETLENSSYRLLLRMPCERCVIPTIDQDNSILHPRKEPFATLRQLNPREPKRRQPLFGVYATLASGAGTVIKVGDELQEKRGN